MSQTCRDLDDFDLDRLRGRRGEKWQLYPPDVLPAWVAEMDFPLPPPVRAVVQHALDHDDLGYPLHPRPTELPAVCAEHMQARFGWEIDPRSVEILSDVVQGIYVALHQLCAPGEGVVVQTPVYPPFLGAVRDSGRRLVENPLREGAARWELDLPGLEAAIDADTRILLLCNPQNPTGRVFERAELEALAQVALARDLVVVADEIHADLVHPGHEHVPFAALGPEVAARTITLTSATKSFNIPGVRCAVAIFGSTELKRRFNGLPRHVRGGLGSLGVDATIAVWREGGPWLDAVRAHLDQSRRSIDAFVRDHLPGVRYRMPEASYLAWLDCRALALEPTPYDFFLERARVGLSPGPSFGRPGEGFVRLNFGTPRPLLVEILERMAKALRERGPVEA